MLDIPIAGVSQQSGANCDDFIAGPLKDSIRGGILDDKEPVSVDSSSIGKESDDEEGGATDAQSAYHGSLDTMNALEEVLPIRRGISNFYSGKSKSFTSLMEVTRCAKEIAKPENAYSRRRRNMWEGRKGGISKRPIMRSTKSQLVIAVAIMSCSDVEETTQRLPPRHQGSRASQLCCPQTQGLPAGRSFSVVDLPQCKIAASSLSLKFVSL